MKGIHLISFILASAFILVTSAPDFVHAAEPAGYPIGTNPTPQAQESYPDACKANDAKGICDCSINNGNCRACIEQGRCGW